MRSRRQRRRQPEPVELDVTPFMNLMIVLVPVLLLSLVFTHTAIIDLDFPAGEAAGDAAEAPRYLEVVITGAGLRIADDRGVLQEIPRTESGAYDYAALSGVLVEVKRRMPDKRDATILLQDGTDYQTLVFVMDRVRTLPSAAGPMELFPVVSLGDAPREVL